MHTTMLRHLKAGLFAIALATSLACHSVSGHVSTVAKAGDVSFSGRVGVGDNTFDADDEGNDCYEINWYDASGTQVGTANIRPGANHGPIPPGATSWTAVKKRCPSHAGGGGGGSGGGMTEFPLESMALDGQGQLTNGGNLDAGRRLAARPGFTVIGAPLWFDLDSTNDNAIYEFSIRCGTADEALILARQAITSPIGTDVDPRITIVSWFRDVQGGGSTRLVGISRDPWTTFQAGLNGNINYADLASNTNAVQSQLPNGLWKIECNVNLLDVNGDGSWNQAAILHRHAGMPPGVLVPVTCDVLHTP